MSPQLLRVDCGPVRAELPWARLERAGHSVVVLVGFRDGVVGIDGDRQPDTIPLEERLVDLEFAGFSRRERVKRIVIINGQIPWQSGCWFTPGVNRNGLQKRGVPEVADLIADFKLRMKIV